LLDKLCSCSDDVDVKLFYDVVGMVSDDVVRNVIDFVSEGKVKELFSLVEQLERTGKKIDILIEQILLFLKNSVVNGFCDYDSKDIMVMINGFSDVYNMVKFSNNSLLSFEVGVLKIVNNLKSDNLVVNNFVDKSDNGCDFNDKVSEEVLFVDKKSEEEESLIINEGVNVDFSVVINNAFALADKNLKNDVISKWKGFYDYVHNKEFSMIVSYFLDSTIQVVGDRDVIISAQYDSIVSNAAKNIVKLELLFNLVMGRFYNIAFVLESEWEKLKEEYILSIKNDKKNEYIEPNKKNDDIIEVDDELLSDVGVSAKEVFGSDIVEIK